MPAGISVSPTMNHGDSYPTTIHSGFTAVAPNTSCPIYPPLNLGTKTELTPYASMLTASRHKKVPKANMTFGTDLTI